MNVRSLIVFALLCSVVRAADLPKISWTGADLKGASLAIPSDKPSVVAFVRPDQQQSQTAIKELAKQITETSKVAVIVFVSGPVAAERAAAMAGELPAGWATVADPEFAASGKMNIHVWPTTLVVKADGTQLAHLAGMSKSFGTELSAHLDFALSKIDETQLKQRLASNDVITDSPAQIAARHLQVAQKLLDAGKIEPARAELAEGLKHAPADPMIQLTLARIHSLLNEPDQALKILETLPAGSAPAWQVALIRGRSLIAQDKWAEAKTVLPDSLTLNPNPAEAHYLMGLCFQHDKDFEHAAAEFRTAFESAPGSAAAKVTGK